ncbi:MAG: SHOCT domain-containing protein [Thermoleophilia bacterium]
MGLFGRAKDLDESGVPAVAEVLSADRSSIAITRGNDAVVGNTTIRWTLHLLVRPADGEPFEATVKAQLPQLEVPRRGSRVSVRYDPSDHSRVELDRSPQGVQDAAIAAVVDRSPRLEDFRLGGQSIGDLMRDAMADPAGFSDRMREMAGGGMAGMAWPNGAGTGATPAGDHTAPAAPAEDEVIAQLERLASLRERGMLTQDEFEAQKRRLLGG